MYFKGEKGFTQTIMIPLNQFIEEIYECSLELIDVGNLSFVHVKLDGDNIRLKLNTIELEHEENKRLHFPIHRWLDSNGNTKLDVLINEGPIQFTPIYTIIVHTGSISSCCQAHIRLALIGDGASSLPIDLNSNIFSIQCSTKNLFQSGSKDMFSISSSESIDIGQLFHAQFWCDSMDKLPYYCESIEIINNLNEDKYFFLINQWFGPNLEQQIFVPVVNRIQESSACRLADILLKILK
ncbi:hypothetical protein I4U23_001193 [Adineta vaga]|nr:hypothetical protein I4U23_001193 [Adineta vaga]